jgi:hypothetical protein
MCCPRLLKARFLVSGSSSAPVTGPTARGGRQRASGAADHGAHPVNGKARAHYATIKCQADNQMKADDPMISSNPEAYRDKLARLAERDERILRPQASLGSGNPHGNDRGRIGRGRRQANSRSAGTCFSRLRLMTAAQTSPLVRAERSSLIGWRALRRGALLGPPEGNLRPPRHRHLCR